MSRNQRIGLIVAAVLVAVLAFVIASPGGDDDGDQAAQTTTTPQSETSAETESTPTETETEAEPPAPVKAVVTGIEIRGWRGRRWTRRDQGQARRPRAAHGDAPTRPTTSTCTATTSRRRSRRASPRSFRFIAELEGEFEIESHVAEDAGRDPLLGTLIVEPK